MSEMTVDSPPAQAKRIWLKVTATGFVLALIALVTVALVTMRTFEWVVGWAFLPVVTSGVIVGGVVMLVGSVRLPEWKTWRGVTLIVWSLIAISSPLLGLMFLVPWALLLVTAPLIVWILRVLFRQ
jgi:hypothetical protein